MAVWRAGQLRNGHGGGGILCLALPALHTGSSGAQGPWSEFKTKPQPAVPIRGYGPAGPLRGQGACLLEGAARTGVSTCASPGGGHETWQSSVLRTRLQASSSSRRLTPARPEAQHSQSQSGRASRPARFIQDHPARPTGTANVHGRLAQDLKFFPTRPTRLFVCLARHRAAHVLDTCRWQQAPRMCTRHVLQAAGG